MKVMLKNSSRDNSIYIDCEEKIVAKSIDEVIDKSYEFSKKIKDAVKSVYPEFDSDSNPVLPFNYSQLHQDSDTCYSVPVYVSITIKTYDWTDEKIRETMKQVLNAIYGC